MNNNDQDVCMYLPNIFRERIPRGGTGEFHVSSSLKVVDPFKPRCLEGGEGGENGK